MTDAIWFTALGTANLAKYPQVGVNFGPPEGKSERPLWVVSGPSTSYQANVGFREKADVQMS